LVVVLADHAEALAGADAGLVEKEQQLVVALVEAGDSVALALGGLGKGSFAALLTLGWTFGQHLVAVGTGAALAQLLLEFGFKGR
jgi:hypothetical protein